MERESVWRVAQSILRQVNGELLVRLRPVHSECSAEGAVDSVWGCGKTPLAAECRTLVSDRLRCDDNTRVVRFSRLQPSAAAVVVTRTSSWRHRLPQRCFRRGSTKWTRDGRSHHHHRIYFPRTT